ncbi:UDP-N-acetylmuramate--L-alanine ligase, partial [Francisella tularensis subsp. holarctica]|nr:UDP-N-acetylmuramate--L-alanine ligase [Francisella tularensis subsp. holarctica]
GPQALSLADQLILLPTYSADEQIIKGDDSQDIVKGLSGYLLADGFDHEIFFLEKLAIENNVILIQGAGDVKNLVEIL